MKWVKIASLTLVTLVLVFFALLGYQYTTRGTPIRAVRAVGDSAGAAALRDSSFLRHVQLLTKTNLANGHVVEPLFNGDGTYPRLWQDLRSARQSIIVQLYYAKPGAVADSLQRVLMERARAGVLTLALFDAFGAQDMSDVYKDSLRASGVRVAELRPLKWYSLHKAQHRSHTRIIVVDGNVAYTGGFGVADVWLGNGHRKEEWRETNVRFTGPAVQQMQSAFSMAWAEATGELLTGTLMVPAPAADSGGATAGLLHAEPAIGSTAAERYLALTIESARTQLFITNAYFVPDDDFRRMLRRAARRGVDVRVLTAGKTTDVNIVRHAARRFYEELLRDGVRIYEYQPTMLHAKTIVADGIWSTIGTMNFDNRSLAFNDESNLLIHDAATAAILERQFLDDLRFSEEIKLAEFSRRSFFAKALERAASVMAKML